MNLKRIIMSEEFFKNESPKKGAFFLIVLGFVLLFTLMSIGVDVDQYLQHNELKIPSWYFIIIFVVDVLMILSILLIFFYRKIGVFLYPILMGSHFYFHMYYLDTFLYNDVMALFLFVFSLLAIIPKWQFFK